MEAVIEKECSALGGLFQTIISDMKVRDKALGKGGTGERKPLPTLSQDIVSMRLCPM